MALPAHVKQQAMDAVSHSETTSQIRLVQDKGSLFHGDNASGVGREIPASVKQQAMDAVSSKETTAQIRMVKDNGSVEPVGRTSHATNRVAEKVAAMQKSGQDAESVHRTVTKDNFGRE